MIKPTGVERYIYVKTTKELAELEHKACISILSDKECREIRELYDYIHHYWVKYKEYIILTNKHYRV